SFYHKISILFLFLSFLPLSQCGIIFGPESPGFTVLPIDGKIDFSIVEDYEDYEAIGEPFIKLSMVTEKHYGCLGYSINANINIVGNNVIVRIFGIKTPLGACATAISPAHFFDKLNLGGGKYNLLFFYKETVDSYYLTVTDSSIHVEQNKADFTSTKQEMYWRYPEKSFSYFSGISDSSIIAYEDFLDTLTTNLPITEFQFPDFGKNPFENSNRGQHVVDFPSIYFKYENEEDFEKAGALLKSYTENVIGNNLTVSLTIISWKNRRFTARQFMEW
ncbi:hypothetical protein IID62_09930, partial [candidate division KSB1 bacterium]|nr:hypothetical protein [candidate division KSB1 bacterium]